MAGPFKGGPLPEYIPLAIEESSNADRRRQASPTDGTSLPHTQPMSSSRHRSRGSDAHPPPQASRDYVPPPPQPSRDDLPQTYRYTASNSRGPSRPPNSQRNSANTRHARAPFVDARRRDHVYEDRRRSLSQSPPRYERFERGNRTSNYSPENVDARRRNQRPEGSPRSRSRSPQEHSRRYHQEAHRHRRSRSQSPVRDHYNDDLYRHRGHSRVSADVVPRRHEIPQRYPSPPRYSRYGNKKNYRQGYANGRRSRSQSPRGTHRPDRASNVRHRGRSPSPVRDRYSGDDRKNQGQYLGPARDAPRSQDRRRSRSLSPPRSPARGSHNDKSQSPKDPLKDAHPHDRKSTHRRVRNHSETQRRPHQSAGQIHPSKDPAAGREADEAQQRRSKQIREDRQAWLKEPAKDAPAPPPAVPQERAAAGPSTHAGAPPAPSSPVLQSNTGANTKRGDAQRSESEQIPLAPPNRRSAPKILKKPPGSWQTAELPKTDNEQAQLEAYTRGKAMEQHCERIFARTRKPVCVPKSAPAPRPVPAQVASSTPVPHCQVNNAEAHPLQNRNRIRDEVQEQQPSVPSTASAATTPGRRAEQEANVQTMQNSKSDHIVLDRRPDNRRSSSPDEATREDGGMGDRQRASGVNRQERLEHDQVEHVKSPKLSSAPAPEPLQSATGNTGPAGYGAERPNLSPSAKRSGNSSTFSTGRYFSNHAPVAEAHGDYSDQSPQPSERPAEPRSPIRFSGSDYIPLSESPRRGGDNNRVGQNANTSFDGGAQQSGAARQERSNEREPVQNIAAHGYATSQMNSNDGLSNVPLEHERGFARSETEDHRRQSSGNGANDRGNADSTPRPGSNVRGLNTGEQSPQPLSPRSALRAETMAVWGIKPSDTNDGGNGSAAPAGSSAANGTPLNDFELTREEKTLPCGVVPARFSTRQSRIALLQARVRIATPGKEDLRLDLLHAYTEDLLDGKFEEHFWDAIDIATRFESTNAKKRAGGRRKRRMKQERKKLARLNSTYPPGPSAPGAPN